MTEHQITKVIPGIRNCIFFSFTKKTLVNIERMLYKNTNSFELIRGDNVGLG